MSEQDRTYWELQVQKAQEELEYCQRMLGAVALGETQE